jgi:indolepyruvate ferredoxin oxidoreductase
MVVAMDRNTATFTQMGGEGVPWIGQAPFCERDHVFANLGDGTFFHSGSLAIRASIAAKVNITYKLLFNDAVAMTGGQALDGDLSVPKLAQMLAAEGITRIAIVAEQPENHAGLPALIDGVTVDPRKQLDEVQRKLRDHKGVSALIFDQTCAAEKRRRRKRGSYPDAGRRVVINELVCEGCGDCQQASNCLSVVPKTTEFGRKRQIDQSTCNQDYSCVEGFCPSFVTIEGGRLRKPSALTASAEIPSPKISNSQSVCNIFVTGVGGTGVVTIGALLGMAAHLEGRGCTVMDMLGMAQKGGPVVSHIRLSPDASTPASVRVPIGGADLLLATDVLVAAHTDSLQRLRHGTTHAVVNLHEAVTGDGIRDVDAAVPVAKLGELLRGAVGDDCYDALEATALATALIGDAIATNVFLLGYSFQKGLIPLSDAALRKAIRLNGGPIKTNLEAFDWGRRAAADIEATRLTAGLLTIADPTSAAVMIQRRAAFLVGYQDTRYARQYEEFLQTVQSAENHLLNGGDELTKTVAQSLFKLMAYKDEYEVARLHTDNSFLQSIAERFEPGYTLKFHLAPPILSHTGPNGRPQKRVFGRWILPVFRLLARLKGLRGSAFDLFGYTRERRTERSLIFEYRATIERILASLTPENYDLAIEIAAVPEMMRGYGHVKAQNIDHARSKQANLLDRFERTPAAPFAVAAE